MREYTVTGTIFIANDESEYVDKPIDADELGFVAKVDEDTVTYLSKEAVEDEVMRQLRFFLNNAFEDWDIDYDKIKVEEI